MFVENITNYPISELIKHWQIQTGASTYFGVPAIKNPGDAWVYQEIVTAMQPDVIIELGVKHGGGALMLAHLCDLMGKGKVIGVDITMKLVHQKVKDHPRITLIEGDATTQFDNVTALIKPDDRVLIIEDSAHTYDVTLTLLNIYSPLIRVGDYFIVEDGINYAGVFPDANFEAAAAINEFVAQGNFVPDRTKESYVITWNPRGFLKRIR